MKAGVSTLKVCLAPYMSQPLRPCTDLAGRGIAAGHSPAGLLLGVAAQLLLQPLLGGKHGPPVRARLDGQLQATA